jgi:predicted methyltransferase
LKKGGKLFHYVGEPGKLSGKNFMKGIVKRLLLAGFKKVDKVKEAAGIVAKKI